MVAGALGAGLVAVHRGEACVDGWVGDDQAVDVGEPEEATHGCIEVVTEEAISPDSPRYRMYSSMCARWIPTSGSRSRVSH
jgi:hypothetical protein